MGTPMTQLLCMFIVCASTHLAISDKVCSTWTDFAGISRSYLLICGSYKFSTVYAKCEAEGGDLAIFGSMDDIYAVSQGIGLTGSGERAWVGLWNDGYEWQWDDGVSSFDRGIDVVDLGPYYAGDEAALVGWMTPEIEALEFTDSSHILCSKHNPNPPAADSDQSAGDSGQSTGDSGESAGDSGQTSGGSDSSQQESSGPICSTWTTASGVSYDYYLICGSYKYYDGFQRCENEGGEIAIFNSMDDIYDISDALSFTASGQKAWVGLYHTGSEWMWEDGTSSAARGIDVVDLSSWYPGDEAALVGWMNPEIEAAEWTDSANVLCSRPSTAA